MTRVRSNCRMCGYLCALTAAVENDHVISVGPDPTRYPYDATLMKACRRWRCNPEILDHPQRINHPLKRVGDSGSGRWRPISWSDAVGEISLRLADLKQRYGAETLATSIGGPHATYWPMHRFLNLFGSPNNIGIGQICWNPAIWTNTLTFGWPIENELDPKVTKCAVLWGTNPAESDNSVLWRSIIRFARDGGTLIVVDPRRTRTAQLSKHWLSIRPATDSALAMALVNIIIRERLYDADFVEQWCSGFPELATDVAQYGPERCAEITGIAADKIIEVARLFAAERPSTILHGRGIDQIGANSMATHRAVAILKAFTGNVDIPGANHLGEMPDFIPEIDLELSDRLPAVQREKQLGRERLLLQTYSGYEQVTLATRKAEKRLPERYLTSAHPNLVWRAMLTGEPYPIRAMVVMGSNPVLTQADSQLICKALKSLDLLVVLEYFKTPTAIFADYIMPSAGGLERAVIQTNAGVANLAYGGPAAVQPRFERRTDFDFWRGLGLQLGQAADWPWQTFEQALDAVFHPVGLSWQEFSHTGLYAPEREYEKHVSIKAATGTPAGFATPSGKIELYSQILGRLGYELAPKYQVCASSIQEGLLLITGARWQPFYASSYRHIRRLREQHPQPWAEMSAETLAELGLHDGSEVWVETRNGRARFVAKEAVMCSDVVSVEYGWWFPEKLNGDETLSDVLASNANVLTNADFEQCDPLLGQWQYNGLPCHVIPVLQDYHKEIHGLADTAMGGNNALLARS